MAVSVLVQWGGVVDKRWSTTGLRVVQRAAADSDGYAGGSCGKGCGVDRRVFINYRGEDSHSYGDLLYIDLIRRFGADLVFLDCESIPAGADFVTELLEQVRLARVVLA
jgi:hypothetical protein